MRARVAIAAGLLVATLGAVAASAARTQTIELPLRQKSITLTVYRPMLPDAQVKGIVLMGSGDVGWVGLAVTMSETLRDAGYVVAGINVRQYLSVFTSGKTHVTVSDIPGDYAAMIAAVRRPGQQGVPVILSGVSEGAALSVAAASSAANHAWVSGVIAMGLPATAELAWRWTDFTSWITKKDADEPSFNAADVIGGVAPVPLCLIQSTTDEYVPERDYRMLEAAAHEPKKLVLIAAANHRFTDKLPELKREYFAALGWVVEHAVPSMRR